MVVCIKLSTAFVFSNGGIHGSDMNKITSAIKNKFGDKVKVSENSFNKCVVNIDDEIDASEIDAFIADCVSKITGVNTAGDVYSITSGSEESVAQDKPAFTPDKTPTPKTEPVPKPTSFSSDSVATVEPEPEKQPVLERITDMVGASDFKKLCEEIHMCSSFIKKNKTQKAFLSEGYIFSINLGGGFSYSLSLLSELLEDEGIFEKSGSVEEFVLPSPTDDDVRDKLKGFMNAIKAALSSTRVVAFDITNWISLASSKNFKDFLLEVFRFSGKSLIVFRTPAISSKQLLQLKKDISDIILVKPITFEPFDAAQQREIAKRIFDEANFTVSNSAWDILNDCVTEEKHDGYYYEIYTIRKIAHEMIKYASLYFAINNISNNIITEESISELRSIKQNDSVRADELFNSYIGIDSVKEQLLEIANQIEFSRANKLSIMPCMHMTFVGNPGTGKTSVARIFGQLLNERGILRIGKLFEYKGRDLCGKYVGHTAPKTTEICQQAYGSILFIDEAYSLFRSDSSSVDYGREAIDTLITEMENHSNDLVVILAGYPDDMTTLLDANFGLKSRIPYTIQFPNFSRKTLCDIYMNMVKEYFQTDDNLLCAASNYFESIPDEILESKSFGNARFVRNIFERTWGKAAARNYGKTIDNIVVNAEDFLAAIESIESGSNDKKASHIGF